MKNKVIRILVIVFIILLNIGCDQTTKYYAKSTLRDKGTVQVIGDFFILRYAENNGAFLGMFASFPKIFRLILLTLVPVVAIVVMIVWLISKKRTTFLMLFFLCCFIGGGMSNLIDRFLNNEYVADFMNLGIGNIRTGIFNFADLSILLGAIGIFLLYLMTKKESAVSSAD
jgi:signal peptidase II